MKNVETIEWTNNRYYPYDNKEDHELMEQIREYLPRYLEKLRKEDTLVIV